MLAFTVGICVGVICFLVTKGLFGVGGDACLPFSDEFTVRLAIELVRCLGVDFGVAMSLSLECGFDFGVDSKSPVFASSTLVFSRAVVDFGVPNAL